MHQGIIEHVLPGRMRLRFREQRGNSGFFQELVERLERLPDVERVLANPLTGSILIFHRGSPGEIAAHADAVEAEPRAFSGPPRQTPQIAGRAPAPTTITLCGLALYQLVRGRLANNAAQQFWYAERAAALQHQHLAFALALLGLLQGLRGRWLAPASSFLMYALLSEKAGVARRTSPAKFLRRTQYARLRAFLPGAVRHQQ